jgi:hypothetical protein
MVVFTCGRRHYLERTLESFHAACDHDFSHRLIIDDSGDPEYGVWLRDTFRGWHVVSHDKRRGLGAAVESGWSHLTSVDAEFVFHLEDDFAFREVPLRVMVDLLRADDALAQVVLYRQPWSPEERVAGGYLRLHDYDAEPAPPGFELWTSQRLFGFNPTLYPKWITSYPGGVEAAVTERLTADGYRFGVLAGDGQSPLCVHIGAERSPAWIP